MWLGPTLIVFSILVAVASPFLAFAGIARDYKRRLRILDMMVVVAIGGILIAGMAGNSLNDDMKILLLYVIYSFPIALMGLYLPREWDWIAIGCWLAAALVVIGVLAVHFPSD